jgi:hypothetical protein
MELGFILDNINAWIWIFSNLLVGYIGLVLIIFVSAYYVLFNPRLTTAGRFIFRFALSLVLVFGLIFISLFVDPSHGRSWTQFPGDVLWWRPVVRLFAYGYVAYTVTGLAILLGLRKWKPQMLRTSLDVELVQTRPPIIKKERREYERKRLR